MPTIFDSRFTTPDALRALPREALPGLADELRDFILHSVGRTGGHFAANLGTVELTLALHYVFDTPEDRLVWDVGHQTYPHKALTGRAGRMDSMRRFGGLSGFPRRDESAYDTFGVGHSSTSISAALGMAQAARRQGDRRRTVAIIGDGAMSGGLAFEALNNAGCVQPDGRKPDLLVILNDNEMSISGPVGALNDHLRDLRARAGAERPETVASMFETFGFEYAGPIDGHDVLALEQALSALRDRPGPRLLHVVTRKGKGYAFAEKDPIKYHAAPGSFDLAKGFAPSAPAPRPTFTQVFGRWLCEAAQADPRVVGVTPAMCEGSGMVEFKKRFPDRFYDVGIAEQHALTFAAGLACEKLKPVVAIYSTFLQRAYDQLIHDIALQNLPVVFAIDRAGLVGADGATHAGAYDVAYLRCVPNMAVLTPSDEEECRSALSVALGRNHPVAVRYPRGNAPAAPLGSAAEFEWGKGQVRRKGRRIAILAFGTLLHPALLAGQRLDATVVNMRFAKPLDEALVLRLARTHDALVTVEEGAAAGGAGSAVMELLHAAGRRTPVLSLGLSDRFIEHGTPEQLLAIEGLDADGIERSIRERFPARKLTVNRARKPAHSNAASLPSLAFGGEAPHARPLPVRLNPVAAEVLAPLVDASLAMPS